MSDLTVVLVHGAGHTAGVWDATRLALGRPSLAVDLPGRGSRPADITSVTIQEAADAIVADVERNGAGEVILVGHSVAGTIIPSAAARLAGRVRLLVFVAGITAADGDLPIESFLPGEASRIAVQLADLRRLYRGQTLESIDTKVASSIDSLNFSSQPMQWAGLGEPPPRAFIRCVRDRIQPRALQAQFIRSCRATRVVDIDTGHTPALEAPERLARILEEIIDDLCGAAQ